MKLADAADVWIDAKTQIAALQPQLDEAAKVLKAHFRKTGRGSYRGVGYAITHIRALDTAKARAELADRLHEFERIVDRETLSILDQDAP
jgi:succinyl-CoA synthetase beta subunit